VLRAANARLREQAPPDHHAPGHPRHRDPPRRYLGLPKTRREHNLTAAAINMIRLDAYWTGHPLDRTRTSHLARLDFTLAA